MIDCFNERKEEVLRIYEEYLSFREKCSGRDNTDPETLKNKYTNIKEGKFILIVAGEAKSGKSTFVNAFLGSEILPMDVKQCTSAIIEINHGDEKRLEAVYADGSTQFFTGEEDVVKFLKEHAALRDDYRNIPVTTINNEILIKSKGNVSESDIRNLIKGVMDDNISNMPSHEYEKAIRSYIEEEKDSWNKIVTSIKLSCPFSTDIKGITMIDSPGVNAAGMVGNITSEYIGKADAIIFLKPLTGQANESNSFRKFLHSNTLNRSNGALLLMFTRRSELKEDQVYALRQQAVELYKSFISEEKIFTIDSKVQLAYQKCKDMGEDEIDNYIEELEEGDLDILSSLWYKKSKKERSEFLHLTQKVSNFQIVGDLLERFATKAHYIQLLDFLKMMSSGYETMQKNLMEKLDILKISAENPTKLKYEISKKNDEIEEIILKINEGLEDILRDYTNRESGKIKFEAEKAFENFKKKFNNANAFEEIEKQVFQGQDAFNDFQDKLYNELINTCNDKLVEIVDKTTLPLLTIIPRLTKEDFQKIIKETASKGEVKEYYEEGCLIFTETRSRSYYSMPEHIKFLKGKIITDLGKTKTSMEDSLYNLAMCVTKTYRNRLREILDNKKSEYNDLKHRLTKAEEFREEIQKNEVYLSEIKLIIKEVYAKIGGIEDAIR